MGADVAFEGGINVSPEKYLTRDKSGKIPRPQMPLRKIKRPMPIDHEKELISFFGRDLIPDWFIRCFEIDEDLSNCHVEYYRKNVQIQFTWCPIYFQDRDHKKKIFYTVVNMIDFCERLLIRFNNMPPKIEGIIREIQDRYLPIAVHMELKNCYSDDIIVNRDSETLISVFDMYRPRKTISFTEECLPDLFIHVFHVNYWGEESVDVFDRELDKQLLSFLKKLVPNPCKSRSLTDIISDIWLNRSSKKSKKKLNPEEIDQFFDINVRLVFAALLGIYDHSKIKASTSVRMRLYRYFCMDFPGKEGFSSWFTENDDLILYAMREFLFFSISHIPSLQKYMENHYYWSFLTSNTFETMNQVRNYVNQYVGVGSKMHPIINADKESILSQYMVEMYNCCLIGEKPNEINFWQPNSSWYAGLTGLIDSANDACLNYANRALDKNFVDKLVDTVLGIDREDENNGFVIRDPVNKLGDIFTKKKEEELEDNIWALEKFDQYQYTYDWIMAFYNVTNDSILQISEAEQLIVHETNRSNLKTVLTRIKRINPYDYAVLRCLFFSFKKKYGITFHPLPRFILNQQIETEKKLYGTPIGKRLCPVAGVYYICTSCGDIKTFVLGNRKQKKKDLSIHKDGENWDEEKLKHDNKEENIRELSLYSRGTAMDTTTGNLYCYVKKYQEFKKKRYEFDSEDEMGSRSERKNKKRKTTSADKDVTMDLIKKKKTKPKKKKKKKKYEDEDPPDEVEEVEKTEKKNNNSNQLKNKYMSSRCDTRPLKPFSALGQLITTEETGPCFKCPYCGTFSTYERKNLRDANGHISCGCKHVNFRWKFNCELCSKKTSKKIYIRWVYDDESQESIIRPSIMCAKHRLGQVKNHPGILALSKLKEMVESANSNYNKK